MNLLILSLLMAFGGQLLDSGASRMQMIPQPMPAPEKMTLHPGYSKFKTIYAADTVEFTWLDSRGRDGVRGEYILSPPERDPYPLWRMEAQEPPQISLKSYLCDGACMNAELMPTQKPQILIDHMPLSTVDPGWPEHNYQPIMIPAEPIDVPAVQEPNSFHCKACPPGIACFDNCIPEANYTCTDPSRSLESSVDGLKHWCHRMTP